MNMTFCSQSFLNSRLWYRLLVESVMTGIWLLSGRSYEKYRFIKINTGVGVLIFSDDVYNIFTFVITWMCHRICCYLACSFNSKRWNLLNAYMIHIVLF